MTITKFLSRYNLHDSLISEITFDDDKLFITVDFCYWMQNGYKDDDPETGVINLIFHDVHSYDGITGKVDDFSILDVVYKDNFIIFSICDDYNDVFYKLKFTASSVNVMHERMLCEDCWIEMKQHKNGHTLSWVCENCGYNITTSFFEPYEDDPNTYSIYLNSEHKGTLEEIKLISEIAKCKYLEAKKILRTIGPTEIFRGKAVEVISIREKLEKIGLVFSIFPEFPY